MVLHITGTTYGSYSDHNISHTAATCSNQVHPILDLLTGTN